MSPDQNPFERKFLISVDVKGYSTATEPRQVDIQRDLMTILTEAAARAELDRESWPRQSQGDGELAVLTLSTEDVGRVIDRYVPEIASLVVRHNVHRRRGNRLRLRVALGHGLVKTAPLGYAGNAVIETSRLVGSPPLRRVLDTDRNVDVAVILSEGVHRDYVRAGHTALRVDSLRKVSVHVKDFRAKAYLWTPGVDGPRSAWTSRRGVAVTAAAAMVVGAAVTWLWLRPTHSTPVLPASAASSSTLRVISGDHVDVVRRLVGTDLADASLDLHPRHNDGDEFTLSPWGTSQLAKSAVPASPQSCARTLNERKDKNLILTSKGAADGGDLGIGGWMCLAVDPSTTAGIELVALDRSLPGGAEFAISVWKN